MIRVTLYFVVTFTLACGCQGKRDAPDASTTTATTRARDGKKMETFTGTLESGVMAIGGETTGWRLVGDGESGGIELDVAKVRARAEQFDGRRVTVHGVMTERDYVERGRVRVLVAERIEPSP